MNESDHQLEVTRRKLARLEAVAADIRSRLDVNQADATRETLDSYQRLIRRLKEEITRYESGASPKPERIVLDNAQLQLTREKLASLQQQADSVKNRPQTPALILSRRSLQRTINQLKEEIAWSEARTQQEAIASQAR